MKRIMAVVVGLLSIAGCASDAPAELRSGFTVNGYIIEPGANLGDADLSNANLQGANLTGATMPDGWQDIVAAY